LAIIEHCQGAGKADGPSEKEPQGQAQVDWSGKGVAAAESSSNYWWPAAAGANSSHVADMFPSLDVFGHDTRLQGLQRHLCPFGLQLVVFCRARLQGATSATQLY